MAQPWEGTGAVPNERPAMTSTANSATAKAHCATGQVAILKGREETYPAALEQAIIERFGRQTLADFQIGGLSAQPTLPLSVVIDRISNVVPYYRSLLRQYQRNGCYIWPELSAVDTLDRLNLVQIALGLEIPVPVTVALPSKDHPKGVISEDLQNLIYPLNWDEILAQVGLPARLRSIELAYHQELLIHSLSALWEQYAATSTDLMIIQSWRQCDKKVTVVVVGDLVRCLGAYGPDHRFTLDGLSSVVQQELSQHSARLAQAAGLSLCSVEWCWTPQRYWLEDLNPYPNLDWWSLGEACFSAVIQASLDYLQKTLDCLEKSSPTKRQKTNASGRKAASRSGR